MVHSNHESYVGGLAACYLGSSAPAATARFHLLSFKSRKKKKKHTSSGDEFHCRYKFRVYCHSDLCAQCETDYCILDCKEIFLWNV